MLVLSRRLNEKIMIGDNIILEVTMINRYDVRIGIEAPREIAVHREELYRKLQQEKLGGRV